jgi:hypothetical protein
VPYDQFVVFCHNTTVVGKDLVEKKDLVDGRLIYERAFAGFANAVVILLKQRKMGYKSFKKI